MENWICKADSDVPVVYGDSFPMSGDTADTNAIGHLKYVLNDVDDIRRSYVKLGFHLSEIKRYSIYEKFGYDNLKDFCINNVPVDYSILSRCISVYERFCDHNSNGTCLNRLSSYYEGFSFSQLVELLGLHTYYLHKDLPRLKCYSVAKLRELKKFCLSKYGKWGYCSAFLDEYEESLADNCDVVTDELEDDNCGVATDEPEHSNCDVVINDPEHGNCDVATDEPEDSNCDVATDNPEPVKKIDKDLDAAVLSKLNTLKGSVLYNFVRGFPDVRKLSVTLYDGNGRRMYGGAVEGNVLYSDDEVCHIRITVPD